MSSAPRLLLSCVSENRPAWYDKVYNLVLSVRTFGGSLAGAAVVVNFVGGADPKVSAELEGLGAEVRVVERFDVRNPYANKLRMLELAKELDFDVLVALDCDTVVAGDFRDLVPADRVGAKPADLDRLTDDEWRRLFGALRVPVPERSVVATVTGEPMYPYFNSGVLSVPRDRCLDLLRGWSHYSDAVLELFDRRPDVIPKRWQLHSGQYALACALIDGGFPVQPLPVTMNFPTHLRVHSPLLAGQGEPLIIQYHKGIDRDGFLLRDRVELLDPYLDSFNRARAAALDLPYQALGRIPLSMRAKRVAWRQLRRLDRFV
jgi:hypothetical protein